MRRMLLLLGLAAVVAGCGESDTGLRSPADHSEVLQAIAAASRNAVPESCTDTWVGPATGRWEDAANWSARRVPGPQDQACIGRGERVELRRGEHRVRSVVIGGGLTISGGSLELTDTATYSLFGDLRLRGTAELTGRGSIVVTGKTAIADGTLSIGSATSTADDPVLGVPCGAHTPAAVLQCPAP